MLGTIAPQTLRALPLVALAAALAGCAITIQQPANNATVTSPAKAVVTGSASFTNLRVTVDGTDFSNQMAATGSSRAQGDLGLSLGLHTITASATLSCWYCLGGSTQSTDTKSFVVVSGSIRVCARSGGAPVITLDPNLSTVGQRPGRQFIGYQLQNGDGIIIIVDDAPGLLRTQMLVEVDLDHVRGVNKSKMIEAWGFCQNGSVVSSVSVGMMGGGPDTGNVCDSLTEANDFRSGCTTPMPPMLIDQARTSELWLRKQGTFGNWDYAEAIDQSIWPVFGGRHLRFIWFRG